MSRFGSMLKGGMAVSMAVAMVGCLGTIKVGQEGAGAAGGAGQASTVTETATSTSTSVNVTPPPSGGTCASKLVDSTGYVRVGTIWGGYGWTTSEATAWTRDPNCLGTSTVSPPCTTAGCTPTFAGHMTGSVAACTDWGGFVSLGWNLAQDVNSQVTKTWPLPATGGVTVTFANPLNAEVRLVIGATGVQWCAPLTSGVRIPWSSFLTNCWQGGSGQYAPVPGAQIQDMTITVVGNDSASVPFDICLEDVSVD